MEVKVVVEDAGVVPRMKNYQEGVKDVAMAIPPHVVKMECIVPLIETVNTLGLIVKLPEKITSPLLPLQA